MDGTPKPKPLRPKECMLDAMAEARITRSAAVFRQIATKVGLERCQDAGFARLKQILRAWFPPPGDQATVGS